MDRKPFPKIAAGEWVQPIRKGYRMKCCDCGLVHRLDFKLVSYGDNKHKIRFRAFREEKRSKQLRLNNE